MYRDRHTDQTKYGSQLGDRHTRDRQTDTHKMDGRIRDKDGANIYETKV